MVGTFIGIVMISLLIAYMITSYFFHHEVILEEELTKISESVAQLIEVSEPESIPEIFETLSIHNFDIQLINEEGAPYVDGKSSIIIENELVLKVIHSKDMRPVIFPHEKRQATRMVGLPVMIEQKPYALFIHIDYKDEVMAVKRVILFTLILVLVVGSILILLASRHIVTPIKKLTNAAREMAKGNFSVRLKSKNKDEVGELITSFNHMASEVEKIDKMREDFVSNVSHEIQSPLTSIRGFTKAIRDEVIPKKDQKEYLDIIYQETERLSRLSENILRLASLDSEHHPYHPTSYRLDEQLRRTILATEPQWKRKNLQIQLDLEEANVLADQDLLEQVWLNLITNAIKHSDSGGNVYINLKIEKENIQVSIKDEGNGIPQEALPLLFERFYKVDQSRSRKMDGNGLGLSIVAKILSIHQSSIQVDSEEGKGSTFTVYIPRKSF